MLTKQMKCLYKFPSTDVTITNAVQIVTKILSYTFQKHMYSLHIKPKRELDGMGDNNVD